FCIFIPAYFEFKGSGLSYFLRALERFSPDKKAYRIRVHQKNKPDQYYGELEEICCKPVKTPPATTYSAVQVTQRVSIKSEARPEESRKALRDLVKALE